MSADAQERTDCHGQPRIPDPFHESSRDQYHCRIVQRHGCAGIGGYSGDAAGCYGYGLNFPGYR